MNRTRTGSASGRGTGRKRVRTWKRIAKGTRRGAMQGPELERAREASLALLDRSMTFGHLRLTLLRLAAAVRIGAPIPARAWCYCRRAAQEAADPALRDMFVAAAVVAASQGRAGVGSPGGEGAQRICAQAR